MLLGIVWSDQRHDELLSGISKSDEIEWLFVEDSEDASCCNQEDCCIDGNAGPTCARKRTSDGPTAAG
jgi:hypothetical protein